MRGDSLRGDRQPPRRPMWLASGILCKPVQCCPAGCSRGARRFGKDIAHDQEAQGLLSAVCWLLIQELGALGKRSPTTSSFLSSPSASALMPYANLVGTCFIATATLVGTCTDARKHICQQQNFPHSRPAATCEELMKTYYYATIQQPAATCEEQLITRHKMLPYSTQQKYVSTPRCYAQCAAGTEFQTRS
jgi:hypothetical protein